MNPPDSNPADKSPTTLELIDLAVAAAKRAAHSCRNDTAREHFEYAIALLGESWIAEDGQQARQPEHLIADVRCALDLFEAVVARPLPLHPTTSNK